MSSWIPYPYPLQIGATPPWQGVAVDPGGGLFGHPICRLLCWENEWCMYLISLQYDVQ